MKPSRALLSDFVCRALAVAGIALVMSSWGFVPHRHLHAKAWSSLPHELRKALGNDPTPLVARATDADSRKHTDSLEATRHYFDLDDAVGEGLDLWGLPWSGAKQLLEEADSSATVRRLGVLPWQLEWSYWRLVKAWAPSDSSEPDLEKIVRAAADLGHYLGDAHVPLHTSGNYNGQRTGQRGIHALWETHAVEWLLARSDLQACTPRDMAIANYDPVWTPWEIILESHALVPEVLAAERTWQAMCNRDGHGFRRRGRTMQLAPTAESLAVWDSLTHGHTWSRYCLASQRIAAAWHSAWLDAGAPRAPRRPRRSWKEQLALYLPQRWADWLLGISSEP